MRPLARRLIPLAALPLLYPTALPAAAAKQTFTLEQVMSAPFVSHMTAAPAGARVAWTANAEGHRNVWVAQLGARGSAKQITHYDTDDGQEIEELAWSGDGERLAYTRGGDAESTEHPTPNPALLTAGVRQQVWMIAAEGGEPRQIGEGHGAALSPHGERLAYLLHGQIWMVDMSELSASSSAKALQLFEGRGRQRDLRWAPDGSALAFVSERGDHSFIGVYTIADRSLSFLDPGTYFDSEPTWSPDSRELAFVRQPSMAELPMRWMREAEPWSIQVARLPGGESRTLWRAERGPGSILHEVSSTSQLWWTADNRIVFPWERGGWNRLYAIPADGKAARLLTPGEFEVDQVTISTDRKRIVYSSNQHTSDPLDEDRRHLWSISTDGAEPKALTHGDGVETSPVIASTGEIALIRGDGRIPGRAAVLDGDTVRDLAPQSVPADFPAAKLVRPQQVLFHATDGMTIHGQLFLPEGTSGKHPAVVFFHGGSRRQMLLGWSPMQYYNNAYAMNQYLVSRGYIVLSVNYRSGIGYGLNFRQALHFGAAGASEYNDVMGAGLYLQSRADVDAKRIGVWGGSYGGYLTALALARASDLFAAGVDMHGVHDWSLELDLWKPSSDLTMDAAAITRLAWQSSPMATLDTWRSPVLLIQGDDDRNVLFAQTVRLAHELRARGVAVEEHVFPDEVHDFLLHRDWLTAYQLSAEFFDRKLSGGRAPGRQ